MKLNLKSTIAAPAGNKSCQGALNGIIGNTRRGIVVDKTLDPDSNNPVSNKPVSTALAALAGQLEKGQVVFLDQLPESGEPHKVYVLTATNQRYWWDGNAFVKIVPTDIKDSATIKHTLAENKISLDLDEAVKEKINAALQKPTGMTKTELVGVGTNGQENIEIGDNLTLANGKLSATGGGSGGDNVVTININDSNEEISAKYADVFMNLKPWFCLNYLISPQEDRDTGSSLSYVMFNPETKKLQYISVTPNIDEVAEIVTFSTNSISLDYIKQLYYHFITITSSTSTFYFTYQNTSDTELNTLDSLKTNLAGEYLLCTGHTDSDTAEYISGEGGNVVVGVVDNSDHSTSGITIDSSYTITDNVTPVQ